MSHDDLERRIQDALADRAPAESAVRRAREAAVRGAERAAARRRRLARRSLGLLAAAAVAFAAAATAGAIMWDQRSGETLPVSKQARPAIAESAILARAPWLSQPSGSPLIQRERPLPALRYPPGTTYRAALTQLVRSVAATGTLPAGATVLAALPRGAVWAPGRDGPRLDLTAPFAYGVPAGTINPPLFTIDGSATPAEAGAIARAVRDGIPVGTGAARKLSVDAPALRACQRLPRRAPCRLVAPPPVSR